MVSGLLLRNLHGSLKTAFGSPFTIVINLNPSAATQSSPKEFLKGPLVLALTSFKGISFMGPCIVGGFEWNI